MCGSKEHPKKACGTEYIPSQKELEEVKRKWEQARNQMEASSQEAAELLGKVNAQKERAADQKQIEEQEKRLTDEEYKLQEQMKSNKKNPSVNWDFLVYWCVQFFNIYIINDRGVVDS